MDNLACAVVNACSRAGKLKGYTLNLYRVIPVATIDIR